MTNGRMRNNYCSTCHTEAHCAAVCGGALLAVDCIAQDEKFIVHFHPHPQQLHTIFIILRYVLLLNANCTAHSGAHCSSLQATYYDLCLPACRWARLCFNCVLLLRAEALFSLLTAQKQSSNW
eukprot:17863-Heterococcus_DN1.PRE.4